MSKQEEEHQQSHSPKPEEIPGYKERMEKKLQARRDAAYGQQQQQQQRQLRERDDQRKQ